MCHPRPAVGHSDDEVAILDALAIVANGETGETTFAAAKQADSILLPLFRKHPDHPGIAHYIIYANDAPPLASLALDAAHHYAKLARDPCGTKSSR